MVKEGSGQTDRRVRLTKQFLHSYDWGHKVYAGIVICLLVHTFIYSRTIYGALSTYLVLY